MSGPLNNMGPVADQRQSLSNVVCRPVAEDAARTALIEAAREWHAVWIVMHGRTYDMPVDHATALLFERRDRAEIELRKAVEAWAILAALDNEVTP